MKKNTETTFNIIKEISLTKDEKRGIDSAVAAYMLENPYATKIKTAAILSPYSNVRYVAAAISVLIITVSFGTTSAASKALPGDLLYPVKIHVNEAVELATAFTSEAKVEVKTKHALRRLSEAEELYKNGKLDATTTRDLQIRFEESVDLVDVEIAKMDDRDYVKAIKHHKALDEGLSRSYSLLQEKEKNGKEKKEEKHEYTVTSEQASSTVEQTELQPREKTSLLESVRRKQEHNKESTRKLKHKVESYYSEPSQSNSDINHKTGASVDHTMSGANAESYSEENIGDRFRGHSLPGGYIDSDN